MSHLKHKSTGKNVLLCNTHLYWHPKGGNIRAMQAEVIGRLILREKQVLEEKLMEEVSIVFGGDFNSLPSTASIRHLLGATILPNEIGKCYFLINIFL